MESRPDGPALPGMEPPPDGRQEPPPPTPPPAPPQGPLGAAERLLPLDVIRGFAILGILLINIISFGLPSQVMLGRGAWEGETPLDWALYVGVVFLVLGKFYPLFAMMLGAGLAMQWGRQAARAPGRWPGWLLLRRLFWLALFGVAHVALFWYGDILLMYAMLGAAAVLLFRFSSRVLLFAVLASLLISHLCCTMPQVAIMSGFLMEGGSSFEPGSLDLAARYASQDWLALFETSLDMPPEGVSADAAAHLYLGWTELAAYRAASYALTTFSLAMELRFLDLFALILFGAFLWRSGFFHAGGARAFASLGVACLVVGLAGMAIVVWLLSGARGGYLWWTLSTLFGPILAVGYLWGLRAIPWAHLPGFLTAPLAAVGRTALTNYLLASVVFTTIFNGYGLGMFGQFHFAELFAMAAGFWVVQLVGSVLWLRVFRFGPMERLWRALTYGRPHAPSAAPAASPPP